MEKWTERFQCLRNTPDDADPVVQVYFKKTIEGHNLEGLEEHRLRLSQLPYLRELLTPERVEELEKDADAIPAADRVVSRSDNSKAYDEAVEALGKAETAIRETNQPIDNKEEVLEELSTIRKWMARGKVRLDALGALAVRTLVKIKDRVVDTTIKMPVEYALTKLAELIGWAYKLFL